MFFNASCDIIQAASTNVDHCWTCQQVHLPLSPVLPSASVWKVQPSVNLSVKRQLSISIRRLIKWVHKAIQAKIKSSGTFRCVFWNQSRPFPLGPRLRQLLLPRHDNKTYLFQQLGGRGRPAPPSPLAPSQGSRSDFSY